MEHLNTFNKWDKNYIYKTLYQTIEEYTFFAGAHGTFSK